MQIATTQACFEFLLSFDSETAPPTLTNEHSSNLFETQPTQVRKDKTRITIDAIRLSSEGDISRSYSGDLIDHAKVRRPFSYNGKLYVCTSSVHGPSIREAEAYYLMPQTLFDGQPTTYSDKVHSDHGESARSDPNGFYHGLSISHQGRPYILSGPPLTFEPPPTQPKH